MVRVRGIVVIGGGGAGGCICIDYLAMGVNRGCIVFVLDCGHDGASLLVHVVLIPVFTSIEWCYGGFVSEILHLLVLWSHDSENSALMGCGNVNAWFKIWDRFEVDGGFH